MKNLQSVVPIPAPVPQRQATGLHLIGDLYGCLCDSRLMLDAAHLESFCRERVAAAGLTTVTVPCSSVVITPSCTKSKIIRSCSVAFFSSSCTASSVCASSSA